MDYPKSIASQSPLSPFGATALRSRAGVLQDDLITYLADELDADANGAALALAHHLGLPEDGDLLHKLRAWCSDPDSTVFVLRSVLICIGREDLATTLLKGMQSMTLCVVIQEEDPRCATEPVNSMSPIKNTVQQGGLRFETLMTLCDLDIASALKDVLGADLSYYQILGPGEWVSWSTKARQLKGKQLTLLHRNSPKCKTDQSLYGCNSNMRLLANKKGYTDKSKVDPQGMSRGVFGGCPQQTLTSDMKRSMAGDNDDDETLKKRPSTLDVTFNISSNEDGSPMTEIEDQKPPLMLTPSPIPTNSDTNNLGTYSNLCVTPDTEDSLDCHRSSYPVIASPCVESVYEAEEYEIDDNTYKKIPMSVHPSKNSANSKRTSSNSSALLSQSRVFPNYLTQSDRRLTYTLSPTDSSTMDSIENLNEILGDFSSRGLTPPIDFYQNPNNNSGINKNNNNALNNLNSSSQTDLKGIPQSVDYNQSVEGDEMLPPDYEFFQHNQNPHLTVNIDGEKNKPDISNQTMETDSALSSNFASTNHLWPSQRQSTSGNGSSAQSASTLTDHSAQHHNILPFCGMSPSEYVPHHLLTQLSNAAEFADCSSQSVSFQESPQNKKIRNTNNTNMNHPTVDENETEVIGAERWRHVATNLTDRQPLVNGNILPQDQYDIQPSNAPHNNHPTAAATVTKSTSSQKAQPMFQPPPPPNYPPPQIELRHQQKQQEYNQQLPQMHSQYQQQYPHREQNESPSRVIKPHISTLHHPSPNTQASFIVHTPFSSEECIANYSEPPSYLSVLDCSDGMETEITNEPVCNNRNPMRSNIQGHMAHANSGMSHHPRSSTHLNYIQICNGKSNGALQTTSTNGYPVETMTMYGSNMISSPSIMRRMLPVVNTNINNNNMVHPPYSVQRQEFESSMETGNTTNHPDDRKFRSFKKNDDTYLTACDPPYTNTQELVLPRGSSKSLPPPPVQPQHVNNNHDHHNINVNNASNLQQQRVPMYHSSAVSDGDSTCYNYIDSSKVSSAIGAAANDAGGSGGGNACGASKSLPNETNACNFQGSPSRHPNLPMSPTPNGHGRMRLNEELTKVQGWCPDETDLTIEKTMEDYRCQDGYFMVWRSQEKNRFMITVSHHRVLNHFLVEEERVGNTDAIRYFVYRHGGYSSESFLDLVNHYIQSGIKQPLVDSRMSKKAYNVIHIPLSCPLKVKVIRKRKS